MFSSPNLENTSSSEYAQLQNILAPEVISIEKRLKNGEIIDPKEYGAAISALATKMTDINRALFLDHVHVDGNSIQIDREFASVSDNLASFMLDEVSSQINPRDGAKVIERWAAVMKECEKHHDYLTAQMISSAIARSLSIPSIKENVAIDTIRFLDQFAARDLSYAVAWSRLYKEIKSETVLPVLAAYQGFAEQKRQGAKDETQKAGREKASSNQPLELMEQQRKNKEQRKDLNEDSQRALQLLSAPKAKDPETDVIIVEAMMASLRIATKAGETFSKVQNNLQTMIVKDKFTSPEQKNLVTTLIEFINGISLKGWHTEEGIKKLTLAINYLEEVLKDPVIQKDLSITKFDDIPLDKNLSILRHALVEAKAKSLPIQKGLIDSLESWQRNIKEKEEYDDFISTGKVKEAPVSLETVEANKAVSVVELYQMKKEIDALEKKMNNAATATKPMPIDGSDLERYKQLSTIYDREYQKQSQSLNATPVTLVGDVRQAEGLVWSYERRIREGEHFSPADNEKYNDAKRKYEIERGKLSETIGQLSLQAFLSTNNFENFYQGPVSSHLQAMNLLNNLSYMMIQDVLTGVDQMERSKIVERWVRIQEDRLKNNDHFSFYAIDSLVNWATAAGIPKTDYVKEKYANEGEFQMLDQRALKNLEANQDKSDVRFIPIFNYYYSIASTAEERFAKASSEIKGLEKELKAINSELEKKENDPELLSRKLAMVEKINTAKEDLERDKAGLSVEIFKLVKHQQELNHESMKELSPELQDVYRSLTTGVSAHQDNLRPLYFRMDEVEKSLRTLRAIWSNYADKYNREYPNARGDVAAFRRDTAIYISNLLSNLGSIQKASTSQEVDDKIRMIDKIRKEIVRLQSDPNYAQHMHFHEIKEFLDKNISLVDMLNQLQAKLTAIKKDVQVFNDEHVKFYVDGQSREEKIARFQQHFEKHPGELPKQEQSGIRLEFVDAQAVPLVQPEFERIDRRILTESSSSSSVDKEEIEMNRLNAEWKKQKEREEVDEHFRERKGKDPELSKHDEKNVKSEKEVKKPEDKNDDKKVVALQVKDPNIYAPKVPRKSKKEKQPLNRQWTGPRRPQDRRAQESQLKKAEGKKHYLGTVPPLELPQRPEIEIKKSTEHTSRVPDKAVPRDTGTANVAKQSASTDSPPPLPTSSDDHTVSPATPPLREKPGVQTSPQMDNSSSFNSSTTTEIGKRLGGLVKKGEVLSKAEMFDKLAKEKEEEVLRQRTPTRTLLTGTQRSLPRSTGSDGQNVTTPSKPGGRKPF